MPQDFQSMIAANSLSGVFNAMQSHVTDILDDLPSHTFTTDANAFIHTNIDGESIRLPVISTDSESKTFTLNHNGNHITIKFNDVRFDDALEIIRQQTADAAIQHFKQGKITFK
jgi:hypothetical protein